MGRAFFVFRWGQSIANTTMSSHIGENIGEITTKAAISSNEMYKRTCGIGELYVMQ